MNLNLVLNQWSFDWSLWFPLLSKVSWSWRSRHYPNSKGNFDFRTILINLWKLQSQLIYVKILIGKSKTKNEHLTAQTCKQGNLIQGKDQIAWKQLRRPEGRQLSDMQQCVFLQVFPVFNASRAFPFVRFPCYHSCYLFGSRLNPTKFRKCWCHKFFWKSENLSNVQLASLTKF